MRAPWPHSRCTTVGFQCRARFGLNAACFQALYVWSTVSLSVPWNIFFMKSPKSLSLTAWVAAHVSPAKLSHAAQMACAWLHVSVMNSFISVQLLILPVLASILVQMVISSHERCPFSDRHCSNRLAHFSVLNVNQLQLICRKFGGFNNISRLLCCFALWQTLPALHQEVPQEKKLCCFSSGSLSGRLHFVQCLAIMINTWWYLWSWL